MSQLKRNKDLAKGDKIIARNDILGYYFSARVCKVFDSQYASVKFDDGTRISNISIKNVIKSTDAFTSLQSGDHVMAKVLNEFDIPCWVPGVIQLADNFASKKYFVVLYFNGLEGDNFRRELLKISRQKYAEIVNYIRSLFGDDTSKIVLKSYKEELLPDEPPCRSLSPPDIDLAKNEIIVEIKNHFNSLGLNVKCDKIVSELSSIKKSQQQMKTEMEGKLKLLRVDFEEWKNQEPPVLIPNPNTFVYVKNKKIERNLVQGIHLDSKPNVVYELVPKPEPQLTEREKILRLRSELPEIKVGEEVLARWPDDGWYYRSIVTNYLGNHQYQVEDSLRDYENIYREDLIADVRSPIFDLEVGDPVIALHPEYQLSYAPGQVFHVSNDMKTYHVRFYDYAEAVVNNTEVFKLPRIKFQPDINEILRLEQRWIGQKVIARNNNKRVYELGKIVRKVDMGRQYEIEWPDKTESIQNANHMFGKFSRKKIKHNLDYVLAPKENVYLPGRITAKRGDKLIVRYFDESLNEYVKEDDCFWLSKGYYEDAAQFCRYQSTSIFKNIDRNNFIEKNLSDSSHSIGRQTPVVNAKFFFTGKTSVIKKNRFKK